MYKYNSSIAILKYIHINLKDGRASKSHKRSSRMSHENHPTFYLDLEHDSA